VYTRYFIVCNPEEKRLLKKLVGQVNSVNKNDNKIIKKL